MERPAIDKIVALTAQEHSTLLFTIAEHIVGYAKDGKLEWISKTPGGSPCPNANPLLSHGGDKVLYEVASAGHKCQLMLYDTESHSSRQILTKNDREFFGKSWSWDDSQITVFDSRGVVIVNIETDAQRIALPSSELTKDGYTFTDSIRWLHDGNTLVITLDKFIPAPKDAEWRWAQGRTEACVATIRNGEIHVFGFGRQPSVSPASDDIVVVADNKLVLITADGKQPRIISRAPRYPRYLPLFRGDLADAVWSPDGGRLFFLNVVSDIATDNIYLLDLKSGQRKLFLEKTTARIAGWR